MEWRPFKDVPCAYQLHFHFCFQTKSDRSRFSLPATADYLKQGLDLICERNHYHRLGHNVQNDRLYCLLSLKPEHTVSTVAGVVKSNLAREFNLRFGNRDKTEPLWSIGYYVRSVGKASRKATEQYIRDQGEHHGIRKEQVREIMRWVNPEPHGLRSAHVTFDISYHLVLVTSARAQVFDQYNAADFFRAMAGFADAGGLYIERMSLLDDHIHLLIRTTPSVAIRDRVEDLMNNSCQYLSDKYPGILKNTGAYNVWTQSFYVSTVGDATTAQIKTFLKG